MLCRCFVVARHCSAEELPHFCYRVPRESYRNTVAVVLGTAQIASGVGEVVVRGGRPLAVSSSFWLDTVARNEAQGAGEAIEATFAH